MLSGGHTSTQTLTGAPSIRTGDLQLVIASCAVLSILSGTFLYCRSSGLISMPGFAGITAAETGRSPQSSGEKRKAESALKDPLASSAYTTSGGDKVKRRLSPEPEVNDWSTTTHLIVLRRACRDAGSSATKLLQITIGILRKRFSRRS